MKRILACLLAALMLSGCMMAARQVGHRLRAAESPPAVNSNGAVPAGVQAAMADIVKSGVPGVTAILMRDGKTVFRVDAGEAGPDTEYPVASASKWMAAALVMTVVDEGKLSLDEPVSKVLPNFQGEAGKITLRMLLAQTAGTGNIRSLFDIRQDARMTLAQSADEVAKRPLEDPPGAVFKYGGPGFQVPGAMVEAVTGKRWADLFEERIARPLGMTHTRWEHLPARGVSAAETLNPLLQGGVVTTADDYMRFLTMLAQHGSYEGHVILTARAVDDMETAQTIGKPMAYTPPGVTGQLQYALGNWCFTWKADGSCTRVASPGAFGTYPWIDRSSGYYGIFFMKGRLPKVQKELTAAREAMNGAMK